MWTITSHFGSIQVYEKDLKCLTKGQRLTDNVMDYILTKLSDNFQDTIYIPFFYSQLELMPDKFAEKNIILLNHNGEHWLIAIWYKKTCEITFLDSLHQDLDDLKEIYETTIENIFGRIHKWGVVEDCGFQKRSTTLCGLFCFFNTWWFLSDSTDYDQLDEKTINLLRDSFKELIRTNVFPEKLVQFLRHNRNH